MEVFGDAVITQVEREEPAFSLDVDGGWSDYGDWTQCMRSCGPGTQTRSRTCTNPPPSGEGAPCDGDATETRMCNTVDCPSDCQDYLAMGNTASGIYTIYPSKSFYGFEVYCDMETDGGGWTVFQRREDGSVDFFLNWLDYQYGFGDPDGEHWLGNEKIRNIVKQSSYELRIDLEDFEGNTRYAKYKYFEIGTAAEKFKLRAEDYTGDAGDSLSYHSGQPFSTKDKDSTAHACSTAYKGAWWYRSCHQSNLNGLYLNGPHSTYADGIEWYHWKEYYYSLKKTEMKTRRH